MKIIRGEKAQIDFGCDFVVQFQENKKIKLLQLTDMQIIDAEQRRTPDRLRLDEIVAWAPDTIDQNFGNHVKSLVAQAKPDMIFITGDMVYGSFDDSGKTFEWFCEFMDSFAIPWTCVFGNHDNESYKGVDWQCQMLENTKYGLFKHGNVSGNGNFSVGICVGEQLIRVFHMLDSHGCLCKEGIMPDQLALVRENAKAIHKCQGKVVPAFICMHFPVEEYSKAEAAKGYVGDCYTIGVDFVAKDNDFGTKMQNVKKMKPIQVPGFSDVVKECNIEAMFCGHFHSINTCIEHEGVKWVFGLKTGQYDYHNPGQIGGTLVTLENENFSVSHLPSLAKYAPFPYGCNIFDDFFVKTEED